jgi:hypothetical protein
MQHTHNVILHEKNLLVAYTLAYNAEFAADVLWTSPGCARYVNINSILIIDIIQISCLMQIFI